MKQLPDNFLDWPERRLTSATTRFLSQQGYRLRTEVPNMGQSADIVATRGRWVTFIEVKVHDWRRGLAQCRAHQQVADFICLVVGTKSISTSLMDEVKTVGYGLIQCSDGCECRWIIDPARNLFFWRPQRQKLSGIQRTISYVD